MTETLSRLLLRLSEAEHPVLWGRVAAPHFGRDFDRMLGQRVLVEEAPTETWGLCSSCECGLDARPIQRIHGSLVAVCPLDHQADAHLTDTDIRIFRIDPAMLARMVSVASGLDKDPETILPGLWRMGAVDGSQAVFIALSIAAAVQPGLMGMLTRSAGGSAITLLAPQRLPAESRRLFVDAGMHVVALLDALGNDPGAPFALQRAKLVPTLAPKLQLDRARFAVSLHGAGGTLPKRPFDLLWILAEAGGAVVERRTIESHLWSQPVDKTAVNDAVRDLRRGLTEIDRRGKDLIETKAGRGYRVALDPREIALS